MNWYKTSQTSLLDLSIGAVHSIKLGNTTIQYGVFETYVKIYSVRTPQNKRNEGSARSAMEQFLAETDKKDIIAYLDCSPLDRRTNGDRLMNFYKSLGFVATGRLINAYGDPEMKRMPK